MYDILSHLRHWQSIQCHLNFIIYSFIQLIIFLVSCIFFARLKFPFESISKRALNTFASLCSYKHTHIHYIARVYKNRHVSTDAYKSTRRTSELATMYKGLPISTRNYTHSYTHTNPSTLPRHFTKWIVFHGQHRCRATSLSILSLL